MKIDFQEKIDDYVLGKMSAEDRDKFEKEVSRDIEKQEQLKLTQHVSTVIKSRNKKLAMMQEWEQERIAFKRKIMAWASSAIGVAAVLLVGVFLFVPKSDDVEFGIKEAQVYKKLGDSPINNSEALQENAKPEELTEERFQYLEQKVYQFLDYLQCLQDGYLSTSAYEKALDFLMDSQLVKTLHKEEAKIIILSEHGKTQEMLLSKYLQRLKNGIGLLGKLQEIELYEVDQSSIRNIDSERYSCDICTHALSTKKGMIPIRSIRETIEADSETIKALKKNGGAFIGKIEMIN